MKEHEIYLMKRRTETISMGRNGNCEARFINNRNSGSYTIIFKYRRAKDCRFYTNVLLEKINEARSAYKGNREIAIEVYWHGIVITNAIDNGIDISVFMDDMDLMLELDYILDGGESEK